MKNGLGALDRALDMLGAYAVEDDIPIDDPQFVTGVVEDARAALDDVRELVRAGTRFVNASEAPGSEHSTELRDALDRLLKEGARV